MSLVASCQCGKSFQAKPELAGKNVKCPACGATMTVPKPAASKGPASAPSGGGIRVSCGCGKTIVAPATMGGKKGKCPGCGAILAIPAASGGGLAGAAEAPADPFGGSAADPLGGQASDPFGGGAGLGLGGFDADAFGGGALGGGLPAPAFGAPAPFGGASGSYGGQVGVPAGAASSAPRASGGSGRMLLLIAGGGVGGLVLVAGIIWAIVIFTDDAPQTADATTTMTMPGMPPGVGGAPGVTPGTAPGAPPGISPPGVGAPGVGAPGTSPPGTTTPPGVGTIPAAPGGPPGTPPGAPGVAPGISGANPPGATGATAAGNALPPGWIAYRSAADRYSVAMPKQPQEVKQSVQGIDISAAIADLGPDGAYMASTTRLPPEVSAALDAKTALDAPIDLFLLNIQGKRLATKDVQLKTLTGREVQFEGKKEGQTIYGTARFFVVNGWNYQFGHVGLNPNAPAADLEKFFNSFQIDETSAASGVPMPGAPGVGVPPGAIPGVPGAPSTPPGTLPGAPAAPGAIPGAPGATS